VAPQLAYINQDFFKGKTQVQAVAALREEGLKVYHNLENELKRVSEDLERTHGVMLSGLTEEDDGVNLDTLPPERVEEMNHPLRRIEHDILISVIYNRWIDYLHNIDHRRERIGLRAYGQKDPLNEYKREAFEMFQNLTYEIQRDTTMILFNTR